jgi:uncharacterized protein YndB with AHSA1/START domain
MSEIGDTHRETGTDGDARTVLLRRSYDAGIDDVWDACTDPERIARWFLPVSGDLRLGGSYQLEGNAGGEILVCEPPRLLKVSWIFGVDPADAPLSEVELRLSEGAAGTTLLELEHTAVVDPKFWDEFGPGAVGVGWDLTLLGLVIHLRGDSIGDPNAWMATPEARALTTAVSEAWGAANVAAGEDEATAAAMAAATTAAYVPPLDD